MMGFMRRARRARRRFWIGISVLAFCFIAPVVVYFAEPLFEKPSRPYIPSYASTRPRPLPYTLPIQYAAWVIYYCDETGVPVWLLCRLITWESGWNPECNRGRARQNRDGSWDLGLAQLNSRNLVLFEGFNDGRSVDPWDPETAIRIAARLLAANYAELGTWQAAVCAYNVGIGGWLIGKRPAGHLRIVEGG
jgi:soluble lytic murein transglycosylase-like protein